jgi:hypothetical protein
MFFYAFSVFHPSFPSPLFFFAPLCYYFSVHFSAVSFREETTIWELPETELSNAAFPAA